MNRIETFEKICGQMADTYEKKNHDYGNSFAELREQFPNAVLVRLFDKYMRLKTLMNGEQAQVDESIEDTLIDLANYAIMELVERRSKPKEVTDKKNNFGMDCNTCKYRDVSGDEEPCNSCYTHDGMPDKWTPVDSTEATDSNALEERFCGNCKYFTVSSNRYPCSACAGIDGGRHKWEPKE